MAEVTLVDQYNYMKLVSDGEIIKKSEQEFRNLPSDDPLCFRSLQGL